MSKCISTKPDRGLLANYVESSRIRQNPEQINLKNVSICFAAKPNRELGGLRPKKLLAQLNRPQKHTIFESSMQLKSLSDRFFDFQGKLSPRG
jgi:hypothetical protein